MQGRSEREHGTSGSIPEFDPLSGGYVEMGQDGAEPKPESGSIAVNVAARAQMLPMLRSVVETILLTADFTLDIVTDVRVAVDEVATALVMVAGPGAEIACAFGYDGQEVHVRMSAITRTPDVLREASMSRYLLESLIDGLEIEAAEGVEGLHEYATVVRFRRCRSRHE